MAEKKLRVPRAAMSPALIDARSSLTKVATAIKVIRITSPKYRVAQSWG